MVMYGLVDTLVAAKGFIVRIENNSVAVIVE